PLERRDEERIECKHHKVDGLQKIPPPRLIGQRESDGDEPPGREEHPRSGVSWRIGGVDETPRDEQDTETDEDIGRHRAAKVGAEERAEEKKKDQSVARRRSSHRTTALVSRRSVRQPLAQL